ncbi:MAG: hypothetical protein EXR69_11210 [Myxococcales bacterium]|nr:hypothetical protein [Myxococcales bacterium]
MSFFGTEVDVESEFVEGGGTYLLLLASGTTPGVGTRMLTFLEPQAGSEVVSVDVDDGCGVLAFSADQGSLTEPRVCGLTVDWGAVTVDGQGNAFDPDQVDGLLLGYFEGQELSEVEADFLNLESRATALYSMSLPGGRVADLAGATSAADGTTLFPGFTGAGFWLLALTCSRCYNPAPMFLTVLATGAGG